MTPQYHTIVIGGGCLGCACAFSMQRKLGKKAGNVAIIEKKVLGAGLSSRHSAIIRSANASQMAAKLARMATEHWQDLQPLWGVDIPYEKSGAIWIAASQGGQKPEKWSDLEKSMQQENIPFSMLSHNEVAGLSRNAVKTDPDVIYFHEPGVLQLDSSQILNAMQTAAKKNNIDVIEHCQVLDFECDGQKNIVAVNTSQGKLAAENIINAAGGWSLELFAGLGIILPVALEPVYAANFLVSTKDIPENLPIIADFVNRAYFRRWRGSVLHMHQPRSRSAKNIASAFSRVVMNPEGADVIYDASSFNIHHQQLENYLNKVENRFPKMGKPVFAGGFLSFFDITPDLKFILGADAQIENLFHCLGAGQSLKYAPIFGELMAEIVIENGVRDKSIDLGEYSIARFAGKPINEFWQTEGNDSNSL